MTWRPFEQCKENVEAAKLASDRCASCLQPRNEHDVRHVFVEPDALKEALRRAQEEQKSMRAPVGWAGFLERHMPKR